MFRSKICRFAIALLTNAFLQTGSASAAVNNYNCHVEQTSGTQSSIAGMCPPSSGKPGARCGATVAMKGGEAAKITECGTSCASFCTLASSPGPANCSAFGPGLISHQFAKTDKLPVIQNWFYVQGQNSCKTRTGCMNVTVGQVTCTALNLCNSRVKCAVN